MHDHIPDIANQILKAKHKLTEMRGVIAERTIRKSKAIANYDKALALTIVKLRNGVEMEFEGQKILNPPVTIMEKIAKGICWKERLELEEAEGEYKSLITNIETVKAELNGLQSINKHLE